MPFFVLTSFLFASCTPETPRSSLPSVFYVYRFDPPAFIEFSEDFQRTRELPFSIPPNCALFQVFPSPMGQVMAVELGCPNGQTVLFLDTNTASVVQPVSDADSHFLAWMVDGSALYLRVDSLGDPRIVRAATDARQTVIPITGFTYDLAASVNPGQFIFASSSGLGQGSELWLAKRGGNDVEPLYTDLSHYISFARYSPDGRQIAFLKIPDTQTPFTVGELWVIDSDGSHARKLADADAGHGYAANWSPDGKHIAFVRRENPDDEQADQVSESLVSNIYILEVQTGTLRQITHLENGRTETPSWSPDGNTLAFHVVINDRMTVRIANLSTGEIQVLVEKTTCCPAWMRK